MALLYANYSESMFIAVSVEAATSPTSLILLVGVDHWKPRKCRGFFGGVSA